MCGIVSLMRIYECTNSKIECVCVVALAFVRLNANGKNTWYAHRIDCWLKARGWERPRARERGRLWERTNKRLVSMCLSVYCVCVSLLSYDWCHPNHSILNRLFCLFFWLLLLYHWLLSLVVVCPVELTNASFHRLFFRSRLHWSPRIRPTQLFTGFFKRIYEFLKISLNF